MPRNTRRVVSEDGAEEETRSQLNTRAQNTTRGANSAVRVKAEKLNLNGEGGTDAENEEDTQDDGPAEDGDEEAGSSRGHKRARANTAGDATTPPVRSQDANGDSEAGKTRAGVKTLPRDPKDGYVPGSIVRVKLYNFVTYDNVEFTCGPYLNMILGPNGTGKSSIACALCLGLNFPPSVLGRATEISAFVKDQQKEGFIELELKGKGNSSNIVIRRHIFSDKKSSTFTINGKPATGAKVNEKITELNIQVGNLCSFLPQDKVAEFARMNPQQLLRETQRAAGDTRLTEWHDVLIASGKEMREIAEKLTSDRERLQTQMARNQELERDVERFNQRKKLEHDITLIELAIPFVQYTAARDEYNKIKNVQRQKHERYQKLEARQKPALNLRDELDKQVRDLDRQRKSKQKAVADRLQMMKQTYGRADALDRETQKMHERLQNLRAEEKERKKAIEELRNKIARLEKEAENPPETDDSEEITRQMRDLKARNSGLQQRHDEFKGRQREIVDDIQSYKAEISRADEELQHLSDIEHQKLRALRQKDPDSAATVEWLRRSQHLFKMEVLEPPCITLKLKDSRYADQIDACFSGIQMRTFVTQCVEDNKTFNRLVNDTPEALGKKARVATWYRPRRETAPPPMSPEEMQRLGFDTYAIDQVDYPEGLLWFLENSISLHRTAIALNPRGVDTNAAMHAVANPATGGNANFIVGRVYNQIQRSNYGQRLPTNTTRDVPPTRNFSGQTVDEGAKRMLDQRIKEARAHIADREVAQQALSVEEREMNAESAEYRRQIESLQQRRADVIKIQKRITQVKQGLSDSKRTLNEKLSAPGIEHAQAQHRDQLFELAKKRLKAAKQMIEYQKMAIAEQESATALGLDLTQAEANRNALKAILDTKAEKLAQALKEFEDVDRQYKEIKADSKSKLEISKDLLHRAEPDIQEDFKKMQDKLPTQTEDSLRQELEDLKAQLDMYAANNPGVIEQYENRKLEIASLEKAIQQREKTEAKIQEKIQTAQDNWQPKLEQLVNSIGERFSTAFDNIGCAGEIKISQAPEFEKWAIDILVKFRDDERLQLLTGQRQSGGERALTTIMYLMSLTEEARAPFSLVDEINQGMDQRYERAVHDQMVRVTCKKDSCQYFLITPKLLPGLKYDKRMKVLCVNNGEWLPEEHGIGNLKNLLENCRRRRGGASEA